MYWQVRSLMSTDRFCVTCTWFMSGVVLPEHLDLFEKGIARKLDYSYSGPQAARIARMLFSGKIELGAIHTYLELFARYFVDLTPQVALIAAVSADRDGNLYTGPNTEPTPTIVEATSFAKGIVIAQVGEIVDKVPRVDIPGDQVHFFVNAGKSFYVEPLFTRDPAATTETQILTAMLAIKGLYMPYGVRRPNHGIGFNEAGHTFLRHARATLGARQRMTDDLAQFSQGMRGTIRILSNMNALVETLPGPLSRFLCDNPNINININIEIEIEIEIEQRPSNEIIAAIAEGVADIGIIASPPEGVALTRFPLLPTACARLCPQSTNASRCSGRSPLPILSKPISLVTNAARRFRCSSKVRRSDCIAPCGTASSLATSSRFAAWSKTAWASRYSLSRRRGRFNARCGRVCCASPTRMAAAIMLAVRG
jgi:hypothetical protein